MRMVVYVINTINVVKKKVYNGLKTCKLNVENLTKVEKNVCSSALTTGQRA